MFKDRTEAGTRLGEALAPYRDRRCLVLALPRGGVPVALGVARGLGAPMALLLVRKIGLPECPEVAMGAVLGSRVPIVVRNEDIIARAGVAADEFDRNCRREIAEIRRREEIYPNCFIEDELTGRIAVIVDDGAATGATARAAIRGLKSLNPERIVVAIPVAPAEIVAELEEEADEVVCLEMPKAFTAVGAYYVDFSQLADEDVLAAMGSSCARSGSLVTP